MRAGQTVHVLTFELEGGPPDGIDMGVHVHRRPIRYIPGVRRALARVPADWGERHLPQQAMTRPGRRLGLGVTSLIEAMRLGVDFDLVEAPDYFCPGWAIAASRHWPTLTVLHTPLDVEARYSNLPDRLYLRTARSMERAAAGMARGISAPSRLIREELLTMGWGTVERATVDPIGLDVNSFGTVDAAVTPGRILIAGHITPRKGHDILARAVARLGRQGRAVEVVCVGTYGHGYWNGRPFREYLTAELRHAPAKWRFIDQIERHRLPELYASSELVVVPSRFESFSMVGLEGMLAAKPVVISERCGLAERSLQSQEVGVRVTPVDDDAALAETLDELLSMSVSEREELGLAARQSALSFGDIDSLIPDRIALYRGLV